MLPVDTVRIESVEMNVIGLRKRIHTKKQLDEFARPIQDSQGTQKAYLVETPELSFMGQNKKGECGLALGAQAQLSLIDLMGIVSDYMKLVS